MYVLYFSKWNIYKSGSLFYAIDLLYIHILYTYIHTYITHTHTRARAHPHARTDAYFIHIYRYIYVCIYMNIHIYDVTYVFVICTSYFCWFLNLRLSLASFALLCNPILFTDILLRPYLFIILTIFCFLIPFTRLIIVTNIFYHYEYVSTLQRSDPALAWMTNSFLFFYQRTKFPCFLLFFVYCLCP